MDVLMMALMFPMLLGMAALLLPFGVVVVSAWRASRPAVPAQTSSAVSRELASKPDNSTTPMIWRAA